MKSTDVIIVGAGAAGLMAAHMLIKAGQTVIILEARDRIGGRIYKSNNPLFSDTVELGAEFIHGNLPVTLDLLKEANIKTHTVSFEMWQYQDNKFEQSEEFVEGWDQFLEKVNAIADDTTLQAFLKENFEGEQFAKMCSQIENYVAGYDTADINDASVFALRNEWNHEDEDAQHRVAGGYDSMIRYLEQTSIKGGAQIELNNVVEEIIWRDNEVKVTTAAGKTYAATKAIIAMPLGVLQAPDDAEGSILFQPPLLNQKEALKNIGFGSVIKILLEFETIFWKSDTVKNAIGTDLSTMGFLFAEEEIPTFWTQAPLRSTLLTGWLGGPPAKELVDASNEEVLQLTLTSLSSIFKIDTKELMDKLIAWEVLNWTAEPYTRGSYAYDKVESPEAKKLLQQPVNNTVYFAGEYLYNGPAIGTVEAALTSGKNAAEMVLKT
jgi:monoamine oxidase